MSTTTTQVEQPSGFHQARLHRAGLARALVFWIAGAAPVGAIPLHVLGVLPIDETARFIVLPLAIAAAVLAMSSTHEAAWARRGAVAGLLAVFAYDALRLPMVWMNIWPDFIPSLGGWVTASDHPNWYIGYAWRYFGDGAGIAMAYFTVCGVVRLIRPGLVSARPVALSIGYGIFIWFGLLGTVVFTPTGGVILFHLTAMNFVLSLTGHLIYGSVLGLFLGHFTAAGAGAGWLSGHHLFSKPVSAAKAWTAAHVPVTAIGGLAATTAAVAAVYGTVQLQSNGSDHLGSPALQRPAVAGPAEPGARDQLRPSHAHRPAPSPTIRPAVAVAPSLPTLPTAAPSAPPSAEPSSDPTTPPPSSPTSDPTSTPTSPPPSSPPPPAQVAFTSTPPADPKFGDTYEVTASGGSGGVAFSIDPSTSNAGTSYAACSIDGSTITFQHAGTCVVAASADPGRAVRTEPTTQRIVIARETAAISFDPGLPARATAGDTYAFAVTGAPSDQPVQVTTFDRTVCTVSDGHVSFLAPGSCAITATQQQSIDYEGAAANATIEVVPASVEADLAVTAAPGDDVPGSALESVVATVTGVPSGSRAVLTAAANGASDFRPDADARDACTLQTSDVDATVWTCVVTTSPASVRFVVNTEQSRDVSFEISPVAPLKDPDPENNRARVHWDAEKERDLAAAGTAGSMAAHRRR